MAAPKKPKTAGVRSGKVKAKAASNGATATSAMEKPPATNGNSGIGAVSVDVIRLRAYEVFLARGSDAGDELSDWLTAERELMQKTATHD